MYQRGKALNNASHFGIDDVIASRRLETMDHGRYPIGAVTRAAQRKKAQLYR